MKKINLQLVYKISCFLLSILLPIIIMGGVYYKGGIYWGSQTTILASDSYSQLMNFYANFHDVLIGDASIFYTWGGALGGDFWSLAAYYINSLFTVIVVFFDKVSLPNVFYLITLLKFGAMGGSFYLFAQNNFKIKKWISVIVSLCYALMSFTVAYSPMNMWLDSLIYLPLVIWGINRVQEKKKPMLLYISYSLLFLSNFYFGFMVGVFSFLYMWLRVYIQPVFKKTIPLYLGTSLLAGGTSMIVILPTVINLRTSGEALSPINQFFTPDVGVWDLIVKQFIGSYDTAKFGSSPFIFVGILPLLFGLFFFFSPQISKKQKIGSGLLGLLLLISVYIYPLNLFWHGFHFPNMLLFRFSFLFSFLMCLLSLQAIEKWQPSNLSRFFNMTIVLMGVFLITYFVMNPKRYDYVRVQDILYTLGFCFIYLAFIYLLQKFNGKIKKIVIFLLCISAVFEMSINTKQMIKGVASDWTYPSRENYSQNYANIEKLVDTANKEMITDHSFQRMINLSALSMNESFNFGYSSLNQFSSIRNRGALSYLNQMGYRSEGTNLEIEAANNTLLMNSFTGVEYILSMQDPLLFGYELEAKSGNYQLYKSNYALPLAMMTDEGIYTHENVENQSKLWNYLAGNDDEYVKFTSVDKETLTNTVKTSVNNTVTYSQEQPGEGMTIEWEVAVPAHSQAYLSLYTVSNALTKDAKATITVQDQTKSFAMSRIGQYYTLGYYEEATVIPVKLTIDGVSALQLPNPDVLLINTEKFANSAKTIQDKGISMDVKKNHVTGHVEAEKEGIVLTTIAYDKGWRVYIDGQKQATKAFENGLLSFPVPKGKHEIQFVYYPEGLIVGAFISSISILIFFGHCFWKKKEVKKK